jgi:hypothetical protein
MTLRTSTLCTVLLVSILLIGCFTTSTLAYESINAHLKSPSAASTESPRHPSVGELQPTPAPINKVDPPNGEGFGGKFHTFNFNWQTTVSTTNHKIHSYTMLPH